MKKKKNKLAYKSIEDSKNNLKKTFPHTNIKKAFYISDFKNAKLLPGGMRSVGLSAVFELYGEELNMRVYRSSGKSDPLYDVDEIRAVNKEVINQPSKSEIENHHINHNIQEDMMKRNQLTVEFIEDGKGGFKPNTQPDGMVKAYINFPDPIEEIKKKYSKKK